MIEPENLNRYGRQNGQTLQWYCIPASPRLYQHDTYMPNTVYTDYTDYRVVYIVSKVNGSGRQRPSTGIHPSKLVVGTSTRSAHNSKESKKAKKPTKKDTSVADIWKNSSIYQQTFSPYKSPRYYSVELYTILITYPAKLQWCVNTILAANRYRCIRKIMALKRTAICLKPLPIQQCYLLTYSCNIVFLYSPGCISILPTCQTLITLIALITESFISSPKLTLVLAALNWHPLLQSCGWVLRRGTRTRSMNPRRPSSPPRGILQWQISEQLHDIIYQQTFSPDKYPGYYNVELYTILITYPPNVQSWVNSLLAANRYRWIGKITVITRDTICLKTLSFQQRYLLTYSYNIAFMCSPSCINILLTCQTLTTLITLITKSVISSWKITLTLSFQQRNLLTHSYGIAFLHFAGCINILPTCQTLITLITLIKGSFISSPELIRRPSTGIHRFKVSGGYFDEVHAHGQGIQEGQEAHQEGYFNICMMARYHIMPSHSDGPYGRAHVAHSRWSVATQARIGIDSITWLTSGHMG